MPQRGFSRTPIIILVVFLIAGAALLYYFQQNRGEKGQGLSLMSLDEESTDEAADWKTYRSEDYGFEVKYPSSFLPADKPKYFLKRGQVVTGLSRQEFNHLTISIFQEPFVNYKLLDNAGGYIFHFDTERKKWLHQNGQTSQFVPKRAEIPLEAYVYRTGDITCRSELMVIPHSSYSFVVEIEEVVCDIPDDSAGSGDYIKNPFDLEPEQILSTFRFLGSFMIK